MTEHTRTCTHTGYLYSLNISIIWSYLYDINYWRRKWQPTHLFLPGEFHEQRSLTGCNPWGHKESDRTEQLSLHLYDLKVSFQKILLFNKETNRGFTGEEPDRHHLIQWSELISVQFSLVAQSCPTLCDPMNRSTPGLPVYYKLPEFTQTHAHRVGDAIQPSHPLSSPSPAPSPSQHQGLFNESTLHMRWPKYWSSSFNISPSNEHPDWSPLGWTGWISLQSKGLSRVFFNTTVQKHQFFGAQLSS